MVFFLAPSNRAPAFERPVLPFHMLNIRLSRSAGILLAIVVTLVSMAVFVVLSPIAFFVFLWATGPSDGEFRDRAECRVPGTAVTLAIERRHAHPYLAEYHRTLFVLQPGETPVQFEMSVDSGGIVRINLYRLNTQTVRLKDRSGHYDVSLSDRKVSDDYSGSKRAAGATFLGAFDVGEDRDFHCFMASERKELPIEWDEK